MRRLFAENDVLSDGHDRDQHEVLVHHPDAGVDRRARRAEPNRVAAYLDLALVRVVEPVEDVHQGRLAGTVLAQQRMNLAFAEVEADVIVRHDPWEALGDVAHLEHRAGGFSHRGRILLLHVPRASSADAALDKTRGGPAARPLGSVHVRMSECYMTVVGILTLPAAMCFAHLFSTAISAARFGALVLTLP